MVGGEHERAPVLEPFDVGGDHADLGLVGEVAREVGELEVDLVAGGRPVREADAELLALEDRPALVAALRHERDRGTGEVGAEVGEGVEVGVGAEQAGVAAAREPREPGLEHLAGGADLREPGREDDRELRLLVHRLLEVVDDPFGTGEQHREIDVAGHVANRRVRGHTLHFRVRRGHRVEGRAVRVGEGLDARGHERVRLA